jgi:hypothetical protein
MLLPLRVVQADSPLTTNQELHSADARYLLTAIRACTCASAAAIVGGPVTAATVGRLFRTFEGIWPGPSAAGFVSEWGSGQATTITDWGGCNALRHGTSTPLSTPPAPTLPRETIPFPALRHAPFSITANRAPSPFTFASVLRTVFQLGNQSQITHSPHNSPTKHIHSRSSA